MKLIPLTQGLFAKVDDEDFEMAIRFKWYARKQGTNNNFYAHRNIPASSLCKRKGVDLHTEIMGTPKGFVVDHINHDTLDNRRENLRVCTQKQNICNQKGSFKNSSTRIRGVGPHHGKFRARISVDGKNVYLGRFDTMDEARIAYASANRKYFGEFGGIL